MRLTLRGHAGTEAASSLGTSAGRGAADGWRLGELRREAEAQEEGLSGRHIDGGQLRGQGGGERASVIVLGVVNSVTPEVLAPGGPAQRTINEALDEPLFDLVLVFGLDMFRYIFPVPETEHLHGVEEPRVLPHIPVPDHLVQILVSVQQETRSPPPLVLNYGRLRKDGKVSIV